jgi:hypothetical protein
MGRKQNSKPDDPAQSKRFEDMAKEVEANESPAAFDREFDKVISKSGPRHQTNTKTKSDRSGR